MDRETNDLIARLYLSEKSLDQIEPREFTTWAKLELQRGRATERLRKLAAISNPKDHAAIEQHFRDCVADFGWEIPRKKAALKRHAESIMQSMVDGGIELYDGCSHLYIVSIFLKHPDYLYNWNGLFWGREDFSEEELNALILAEAKRGLAGEVTINEALPHHDEEDEKAPGFMDRLMDLIKRG